MPGSANSNLALRGGVRNPIRQGVGTHTCDADRSVKVIVPSPSWSGTATALNAGESSITTVSEVTEIHGDYSAVEVTAGVVYIYEGQRL
jgi:hypothetical protein